MSRCRRGDAMLFPEFVSRALVVRGREQPHREWSAANRRVSILAVWRASQGLAFLMAPIWCIKAPLVINQTRGPSVFGFRPKSLRPCGGWAGEINPPYTAG